MCCRTCALLFLFACLLLVLTLATFPIWFDCVSATRGVGVGVLVFNVLKGNETLVFDLEVDPQESTPLDLASSPLARRALALAENSLQALNASLQQQQQQPSLLLSPLTLKDDHGNGSGPNNEQQPFSPSPVPTAPLLSVSNFSHGSPPGAWACASEDELVCRLSA